MAQQEVSPFTGFGIGKLPKAQEDAGVFILAIARDGALLATAYATEHGAMEAAVEYMDDELGEEGERGTPEDLFARAQGIIADEGNTMMIIPSPIYGS